VKPRVEYVRNVTHVTIHRCGQPWLGTEPGMGGKHRLGQDYDADLVVLRSSLRCSGDRPGRLPTRVAMRTGSLPLALEHARRAAKEQSWPGWCHPDRGSRCVSIRASWSRRQPRATRRLAGS
jgi:hypothetical protein